MPILPRGAAPHGAVLSARRSRRARRRADRGAARARSRRRAGVRRAAAGRRGRGDRRSTATASSTGGTLVVPGRDDLALDRSALDRRAGAGRRGSARHARPGQGDPVLARAPRHLRQLRRADAASPPPAGGANATPARRSTFPAPIRSSSCSRSTASAACSAARRAGPRAWYSCLAGFVEPGETIEEAVQARNPRGGRRRLRRSRLSSPRSPGRSRRR